MKVTKRQLRRIIKEEKSKLLKESYDPVDEMYLVFDHIEKAQMIAEEIVQYSERDPAFQEYGMPFDSFAQQLKKLLSTVGSQADKAYRQGK
tara:strand:- start:295 stop:567 length:273 start_codon:yes stop_codon:yes gene_type:complete